MEMARLRPANEVVVVCLSGRGDKDVAEIARVRSQSNATATNP
jgi:tryptophan synthase beta subunit